MSFSVITMIYLHRPYLNSQKELSSFKLPFKKESVKKFNLRYAMTDLYAFQMSLILAQESFYEVKYNFCQLRNFYIDFTAVFLSWVNIRF